MSDDLHIHPKSVPLSDSAAEHPSVFARAFNSGDAAAVEQVYEPGGLLVTAPGQPVTGADRIAANQRFLDLGSPIEVRPRHVYVADDIALLIVDWSIDGTDRDGQPVHIEGTATDVARRGPDGRWRYVIDNPFGTAEPAVHQGKR
ncbi:YybH family protein [Micromonospora sp. URMC 106]|uniref:YybH family protein n=1 Tax=Micromonospora sp. URMC 106 TaxID=3423408 RepID=UPI003F1AD891